MSFHTSEPQIRCHGEDEVHVTMNCDYWEDEAELTDNFKLTEYIVGSLPGCLKCRKLVEILLLSFRESY